MLLSMLLPSIIGHHSTATSETHAHTHASTHNDIVLPDLWYNLFWYIISQPRLLWSSVSVVVLSLWSSVTIHIHPITSHLPPPTHTHIHIHVHFTYTAVQNDVTCYHLLSSSLVCCVSQLLVCVPQSPPTLIPDSHPSPRRCGNQSIPSIAFMYLSTMHYDSVTHDVVFSPHP